MIEIENTYLKIGGRSQVTLDDDLEEYYVDDGWTESFQGKAKGWSLSLKDERNYGNCLPVLFYDGEPLIILGPDCKI